jgi:two-component system OmpR family sensor kinase
MRLPIRTRLTLTFAGMTLLVLAVAAGGLLIGFRRELDHTVDEGLVDLLASLVDDPEASVAAMDGSDGVFAQLLDEQATTVLASSQGLGEEALPVDDSLTSSGSRFVDARVRTAEEPTVARLYAVRLTGRGILVVGQDVEDQREAVARLASIVAIGAPVLLVVITLLGWIIAGAALRPVEDLRSEAAAISLSEPGRQLSVPATGDELQRLAETLNGLLDRMHDALDRERRFVDEASHELRTPLGVLKAEVDLALKGARSPEELADALASIEQETDRLRRLTQDLLVLARSDRGRLPVHREDVDVSAVIDRVVTEFEEQAGRAGVRVRGGTENVHARVDADRLRQAIENLVDNAIRYAGSGGTVEVAVEQEDGRLRVSVTDSGPGFGDTILDRAFEPFARVDGDRTGEGAGLGLAIVRAVAEAHGGSASARNLEGGGAEVSVHMPI